MEKADPHTVFDPFPFSITCILTVNWRWGGMWKTRGKYGITIYALPLPAYRPLGKVSARDSKLLLSLLKTLHTLPRPPLSEEPRPDQVCPWIEKTG